MYSEKRHNLLPIEEMCINAMKKKYVHFNIRTLCKNEKKIISHLNIRAQGFYGSNGRAVQCTYIITLNC